MSKVIRLSDQTIFVLDQFRAFKCGECDDPLIQSGFLDMSDDNLIRLVFENLVQSYENRD